MHKGKNDDRHERMMMVSGQNQIQISFLHIQNFFYFFMFAVNFKDKSVEKNL